jgi:electron transfer flavoprotein alpha subunit
MSNKVLVFGEQRDGDFRQVVFEAIATAKQIDEDSEVVGVIIGKEEGNKGEQLYHYGADRVVSVAHERLAHYTPEGFAQAFSDIITKENPRVIVFGHTAIGRDLAPKLASRHKSGLISDVTEIERTGGECLFIRPIYSGKAFEKVIVKEGLTFITIRPNNIPALEPSTDRTGEIEEVVVEIADLQTLIKDVVKNASSGVDLSEASVIVSGGRGMKAKENFKLLDELAEVLGGAVGASRGACDAEYCDYALQIGQTGKVVTPDLYIAVGLSGAIQHVAGMSNSKIIVAINKDPEAEIFQIADYGVVGDLFDIIPKLTAEFKKVLV